MTTTTGPDGEQIVSSPVQTEAGDEIRELLDTAEGLDNNQLKRLWKNMLNRIDVLMRNPQIDDLEKVEFEQKIKDILLRYQQNKQLEIEKSMVLSFYSNISKRWENRNILFKEAVDLIIKKHC